MVILSTIGPVLSAALSKLACTSLYTSFEDEVWHCSIHCPSGQVPEAWLAACPYHLESLLPCLSLLTISYSHVQVDPQVQLEDIDFVISAELPRLGVDDELRCLVLDHMMHPHSHLEPGRYSRCNKDGHCQ